MNPSIDHCCDWQRRHPDSSIPTGVPARGPASRPFPGEPSVPRSGAVGRCARCRGRSPGRWRRGGGIALTRRNSPPPYVPADALQGITPTTTPSSGVPDVDHYEATPTLPVTRR